MAFPQTFLGMQDAIMDRLRIDKSAANRTRVKDWINQHYADLCAETEAYQDEGTVTFTANEPSYLIDAAVLRIKQVIVKQVTQTEYGPPLEFASLREIRVKQQSGAVPGINNGTATHYTLVGARQIEFWPTPQTADTAKYDFVKLPTALSADADPLDSRVFPEPYPKAVEFAALYEAALWQKDPDIFQIERDRDIWLAKFRRHLNRRVGGFPHQFAIAGAPNVPTWDNSRDYGW